MEKHLPIHLFSKTLYQFKWSNQIAMGFDRISKPKLFDALNLTTSRAKMAIGALVTDYIINSLANECDIKDAKLRVIAAWVAVIDAKYITSLDITMKDDHNFHEQEFSEPALEMTLVILDSIFYRYSHGDYYLADTLTKQISIAKRITKSKKQFDIWIDKVIVETSKKFPYLNNYNKGLERFEYEKEVPLLKEFFNFDKDYLTTNNSINTFLQNADVNQNPYLKNTKELLLINIKKRPYTYPTP